MKVKELKAKLSKFDDETEVVIDHDENGWYGLKKVEASEYEDQEVFCNLVMDQP